MSRPLRFARFVGTTIAAVVIGLSAAVVTSSVLGDFAGALAASVVVIVVALAIPKPAQPAPVRRLVPDAPPVPSRTVLNVRPIPRPFDQDAPTQRDRQ